MFNERLTVLNFFYGSSIGSKLKDLQKENQENQTPQELQEKTEDSENTEPHFKTDKSKTDKSMDLKDVKYQKK